MLQQNVSTNFIVRPYYENKKFNGLILKNIPSNSLWSILQIRDGDILKKVDGKKIESTDDGMFLIIGLKTSSSVNMLIQRKNKDILMNYKIIDVLQN